MQIVKRRSPEGGRVDEMSSQVGKDIRLSKILDPAGKPAVMVKADQGLAMGPVEGLEDMELALKAIIDAGVEGIVLGPGQAGREIHLFKGKEAPALLVRSDWSNVKRDDSFPLPRKSMTHVSIAGARHAAFLGAHGIVASFFVGYGDDQDEADNLEAISHQATECFQYGLPLFVEAIPLGERITQHNYADSLKMAGRMSLEVGADALIIPNPGVESAIADVVDSSGSAPVFLLVKEGEGGEIITESVKAGVRGFVLGDYAFRGNAVGDVRRALGEGV